ncbi:MAG: RusA family crossover junction endodeoxyribonuclease [Elusimicrobiota bacterium]|jgi:Holliday junction resolvase RusA-like endonuclease|nr:RusA family crossover junction endodeoxyribonuclease [Elusimicrobiota bacterium]
MKWALFVGARPQPQARPIYVKKLDRFISPKADFYLAVKREAKKCAPTEPINKAVKLTVSFCYLPPECKKYAVFNTSRPDLDNLEKAVMDALTQAKVWRDDCLVVKKDSRKIYRDFEGVYIVVETLKNIKDFGAL